MRRIKDYIDEVKLRCKRIDISMDFDDGAILSTLNDARQHIMSISKNMFPERYSQFIQLDLDNTMYETSLDVQFNKLDAITKLEVTRTLRCLKVQMPIHFIEPWLVILRFTKDELIYNNECRFIDRRELFNVTTHSFNTPNIYSPIYLLETQLINEVNVLPTSIYDGIGGSQNVSPSLLLYGIDAYSGTSIFDDPDISDVLLEIWYIQALPQLQLVGVNEEEVNIPPDLDEMIILDAVYKLVRGSQNQKTVDYLKAEITLNRELYQASYDIMSKRKDVFLPSKQILEKQF